MADFSVDIIKCDGPYEYKVTIATSRQGLEQRNLDSSLPRRRWSITTELLNETDFLALMTFYKSKKGPLTSFTWDTLLKDQVATETVTVRFGDGPIQRTVNAAGYYQATFELIEVLGE